MSTDDTAAQNERYARLRLMIKRNIIQEIYVHTIDRGMVEIRFSVMDDATLHYGAPDRDPLTKPAEWRVVFDLKPRLEAFDSHKPKTWLHFPIHCLDHSEGGIFEDVL